MKKFVSFLCLALFALIGLAPKFKALPPGFDDELKIKIVFLGDANVGKSSIIQRTVLGDDANIDQLNPTNFASYNYKKIISSDGRRCVLELWDTAGQERFRSLSTIYFRDSDVACIVCSTDDDKTIDGIGYWENQILNQVPNVASFLIINKIDLDETGTKAEELKQKLKNTYGAECPIFLTSAKTGAGISELSQAICSEYLNKYDAKIAEKNNGISLTEENQDQGKKKCCK